MYSPQQKAELVRRYYELGNNARMAATVFQQNHPNFRPTHTTVLRFVRRFELTGNVDGNIAPQNQAYDLDVDVLAYFRANPRRSTRQAAKEIGFSNVYVWKILKRNHMHPYHVHLHQGLKAGDEIARLDFCNWLLNEVELNPDFQRDILFSDESIFSRDGVVNIHNTHYWDSENPRFKMPTAHQERFSLNVWAGILNHRIVGPVFIPERLNGMVYRNLLQNEVANFLDDMPLEDYLRVWYQHDGAGPHRSRIVKDYLDAHFPEKWIGNNGPIKWPPRSPDLTPLDFFLWGFIKDKVYFTPVPNVQILRERIVGAFREITEDMVENTMTSVVTRAQACVVANGGVFEHFIK